MKLFPETSEITAPWAFENYQLIRSSLPSATFPIHTSSVNGLVDLASQFDVFLLDAFGVLNVGQTAIKSAPSAVSKLQKLGKRVMVLTNGATFPATETQKKLKQLGFDFDLDNIVSSRDALSNGLSSSLPHTYNTDPWGVMARPESQLHTLPVDCINLDHSIALFDKVCGFILLGASNWTEQQQGLLIRSLSRRLRPVWVGNPDLVAPRERDFSLEPGYFAHQLRQISGVKLNFFGKPFSNIFDLAYERLSNTPKHRIVMVGDTLHTDILGGAAFGIQTALVTGHGLFANHDVGPFISQSGIIPNHQMVSP